MASELKKEQAKRLNLDILKYYDEPLLFKSGNADPKGSPEWIINNGKKMYAELSAETKEFFNFMLDHYKKIRPEQTFMGDRKSVV